MPFYEYECSACGHTLEVLQKISDAPLTECPNCQHETLTKLISRAGFKLTGTGWYETDFKNSGNKSAGSGASAGGKGGGTGGTGASTGQSDGQSGSQSSGSSDAGAGQAAGTSAASASESGGSKEAKPAAG